MKSMLILCAFLLLLPFSCVRGEEHGDLISCEYAVYGGMENQSTFMTLTAGPDRRESTLTVQENGSTSAIAVSRSDLEDLDAYVAALQPDTWDGFPEREEFALDAPTRRVTIIYADGSEFTLSNSKEDSGEILQGISCFLESYTVRDRETFSLTFSSFSGGGPSFHPVISAPEKLAWSSRIQYPEPHDPPAPGSAYEETMEFRGRIPGTVELYIEMSGPLTPLEAVPSTVYILEIDSDYNVRLLEKREQAPAGLPRTEEPQSMTGDRMTRFFFSHEGALPSVSYALQLRDDGGYDCAINEREGTAAPAKLLEGVRELVDRYGLLCWDGFDGQAPENGTGERFRLEIEYENGGVVCATGNNRFPEGYQGFSADIQRLFDGMQGLACDEQRAASIRPVPLLVLEANGRRVTLTPEENPSAAALVEKLQEEPVTLQMHDDGHFEKAGPLPWPLPRNDAAITVAPGDVILCQGSQIAVCYDANSGDFTRLGRIGGVTREDLLAILGSGDVALTCWVEWSE